ncbi:TetR/AcrR family transcriptional regulator [Catenuloplanes atrovinosus]|uniref:AcrR family transcriptional regulator n=1 Tax=Catenuloplanes atrovinosus TaxID=137266 RepID=A0AAE4CA55_9ACTN|nr:TetR/AcrR family transcriptional regulator [Catenuloplanes atrovinosus]MDR7276522.1 AcrR family transcriptional regulator [Catenuloplanes atrovinosus]
MAANPNTRRAQAAEQTRELILRAARERFTADGYAKATVNDIAKAAGVVVATVYTSVGGKPVLLEHLVRQGVEDAEVAETLRRVEAAATGHEVIELLARGTAASYREHAAVIGLLLDTAASEPFARTLLTDANDDYRTAIAAVARRLATLDVLADGVSVERATDVLWYLFGIYSWPRLLRDATWTEAEAEAWLREAAVRTLLRP